MSKQTYWRMLLAAAFLFLLAPQAAQAAIDPATVQKLVASDGEAADWFGYSVSVDGDTAVIGAWMADPGGIPGVGAAYVFTRVGGIWTEQQKLTASAGTVGNHFGCSVSMSGDTAVIGAAYANVGAAYVFTRAGSVWTEQQKLTASDAAANAWFGSSVSVSGDTAVIGAHGAEPGGAAYVFTRASGSWSQQQKLTASDAVAQNWFGSSVSLSGDTVLIGAAWTDPSGLSDAGAAYVFTRAGSVWTEQQKLTASDAATGDDFGTSVALSGDTAVIGAHGADPNGLSDAGAAYVFTRVGGIWSQQQKLTASDAAINAWFGSSVSVSGDTAVIGAYGAEPGGAAYVFTRASGSWSQKIKLTANDGGGLFGYSVSLASDGSTALIVSDYVFASTPPVSVPHINMAPIYKLLLK